MMKQLNAVLRKYGAAAVVLPEDVKAAAETAIEKVRRLATEWGVKLEDGANQGDTNGD